MPTNYRPAKCIELHEAHVALAVQGYDYDIALAGRPSPGPERACHATYLSNMLAARLDIKEREFTIFQAYYHGDNDITALACEVVNAHLINIRITIGIDGDLHAPITTDLLTYSGSFTIWWAESDA